MSITFEEVSGEIVAPPPAQQPAAALPEAQRAADIAARVRAELEREQRRAARLSDA